MVTQGSDVLPAFLQGAHVANMENEVSSPGLGSGVVWGFMVFKNPH